MSGMSCIICGAKEKRGYIVHFETCAEWQGSSQHVGDAGRRYHLLVGKLSPNPKHRERYTCPSCGDESHGGVKVDVGAEGPDWYCFGCCEGLKGRELGVALEAILAAVGLEWTDVRPNRELRRAKTASRTAGASSEPPEPSEPPGPPEDGAALLDEVRTWLSRFITVMRDEDLDLLTLWAAHTHAGRSLYTTPRLQVDSPVPESGKTTVLEHLERLCHCPVIASSISSPALLARLVAEDPRTLLLDEVDRTLDVKATPGAVEIIAVLNSGYKVGATRPVLVPAKGSNWEVAEMSTFAPVAMAGNQPRLPDDTDRKSVV